MKVQGYVTVAGVFDEKGRPIPMQKAMEYGWITPVPGRQPGGWGLDRDEAALGPNLFVDNGRQLLAFAFGGRSPASDFACSKFGVGTGILPATAADVALHNPVPLGSDSSGVPNTTYTRDVDGIDFVSAFMVRVGYTIPGTATVDDTTPLLNGNGAALRERGLYSGNGTLLARHVSSAPINKEAGISFKLFWRLRF